MEIKILGTGCPNCKKLEKNLRLALEELNLSANITKEPDMIKIMKYGVMSLPGIVVDEKVLSYGRVLSSDEIKKLLK